MGISIIVVLNTAEGLSETTSYPTKVGVKFVYILHRVS